jgi:hypothetical protein
MSSYEGIITPEGWNDEIKVLIGAEYSPEENGMAAGWQLTFAQIILSDDLKLLISTALLPDAVIDQIEQVIREGRDENLAGMGDYKMECQRDSE